MRRRIKLVRTDELLTVVWEERGIDGVLRRQVEKSVAPSQVPAILQTMAAISEGSQPSASPEGD